MGLYKQSVHRANDSGGSVGKSRGRGQKMGKVKKDQKLVGKRGTKAPRL